MLSRKNLKRRSCSASMSLGLSADMGMASGNSLFRSASCAISTASILFRVTFGQTLRGEIVDDLSGEFGECHRVPVHPSTPIYTQLTMWPRIIGHAVFPICFGNIHF